MVPAGQNTSGFQRRFRRNWFEQMFPFLRWSKKSGLPEAEPRPDVCSAMSSYVGRTGLPIFTLHHYTSAEFSVLFIHPTLENNFPCVRPLFSPCGFVRSSRFRPTRLCGFVRSSHFRPTRLCAFVRSSRFRPTCL